MDHEPIELLLDTLRLGTTPDADRLASGWRGITLQGFPQLLQYEGCEIWLYRRLSDLALLDHVDARLADWLTRRARQVAAHNILVDTQRDALVEFLNRRDTPHVLLKGSAYRLLADRYPYIDARMAGDVDVLLPGDLAPETWDRLRQAGFDLATTNLSLYENHHHLAPLAASEPIVLEVHTSTAKTIAPDEAWRRMDASARVMAGPGGETRVPSATELFWHAVTHAHSTPLHAFRLRYLQDAATIWAASEEIDWRTIATRLNTGELPRATVARRWLGAAGWMARRPEIAERLTAHAPPFDLHRALRWRLSVLRRLRTRRRAWLPDAAARDPANRARRLIIDVGTATDLGLELTHRKWQRTASSRAALRTIGRGMGVGYGVWRWVDGRRRGEQREEPK